MRARPGFAVALCVRPVPPPVPGQLRLTFHQVQALKDEEYGDTHLALYVHALAPAQGGVPAIDQELLRWNNGNQTVDDPHSYPMSNGAVTTTRGFSVWASIPPLPTSSTST